MNNLRVQLPLILLLAVSAALAAYNHFIIDDAYIGFIYARNFAQGHGLVWAPGSNEFGYTNFLFTLIVGSLMTLGFPPLTAAYLISVPCYLASIWLLFRLVQKLAPHSRMAAFAAAASLAAHYTVSSYATSGLETSAQMLLILAVYYCVLQKRLLDTAVFASLALLVRLDSGLLLIPAFLYASFFPRPALKNLAQLYMPPLLLLALFLALCNAFYGAPLPNTFYAKVLLPRSYLPEGWIFLKTFFSANAYAPLILLAAADIALGIAKPARALLLPILTLFAACALWLLYILAIGGDFMEFRMLVVILPLFYAACFASLARLKPEIRNHIIIAALCLNLAVGLVYAPRFRATFLVGSLPAMNEQMTDPRHNWPMVGQALADLFYEGEGGDVKLALLTTGAIPYFSHLQTVDIAGLNDRWVAQNGIAADRIAGHRKAAPFSYLVEQQVNIAIPTVPTYFCNDERSRPIRPYHSMPALLIPLASGCRVVAYYLHPHPRIEELIRSNQIQLVH